MAINRTNGLGSDIKTALAAGAITAGMQTAMLPSTIKASIKNSALGKDVFLKRVAHSASKTIKNLNKAGYEKTASNINIQETVKRASEMYPQMAATAKVVVKEIGKTFAGITAGVLIGSLISDAILSRRQNKN